MKRKLLYTLIVLSIVFYASFTQAGTRILKEGDKVENFTLTNGLTKKKTSFLHDITGKSKLTAIIFANTSCGACRNELRILSKLSKKYDDFVTYAVLVDMQGADIVESFHDRFGFNVTYLLDPEFSLPPAYGFYFTPSLLLIDKEGKILLKKGGYNLTTDEIEISESVERLVK